MNNPTDTNQAIEDELDKALESVYYSGYDDGRDSESGYGGARDMDSRPIAKSAIQALIRTEKLKLLAEVREQVVGEDNERLSGNRAIKHEWNGRNELRAEQRTALNKLEAEL